MSLHRRMVVPALVLAVAAAVHPLSAQYGRAGGGLGLYGFGPRLGENTQLALERQEQLGLSAEQVASLQALDAGIRMDVEPLQAQIDGLRAQILAGEVDRVDGVVALQALFADFEAAAAPYRTGVTSILTVDQHRALQGMVWGSRPWLGAGRGAGAGMLGGAGAGAGYGMGMGMGMGAMPPGAPGLGRGARPYYGRGLGSGAGRPGGRGMGRGVAQGRGIGRGLARRWR